MVISVASGKGGTGKTTVAISLALSCKNAQLIDCDVEEPNCHLFIKPEIKEKKPGFLMVPEIDKEKCTLCGRCQEICAYNALAVVGESVLVFPELCHGCGACSYLCPDKAIREVAREIGVVEIGARDDLQFVHGRLNIGEAMAPPLIREVLKYQNPTRTVIIDAPPGTSCPVISAVQGSDYCILVTEPTPFGLNDLVLAVEVIKKINIPCGVIINRADLGNQEVEQYCQKENIPVLLRIPFSEEIARAYSEGKAIVEVFGNYKNKFRELLESI